MNTILLVDDEYPSIQAIRELTDWKKIGFDRVLEADSVTAAKEQFAQHEIKVLLCDIEMPGETGLDLLQWIRSYSPETIGVFLTCHADFAYAKEAVRMGAFDYLLKPAAIADIEAVLSKALQEWEKRRGQTLRETLWKKNKNAVIERFWWDVLNGLVPADRERLAKQIEQKDLPVETGEEYLPVSCVIRNWNLDLSVWEKYDLDYTVKNVLQEIFEKKAPFLISDTINRTWILFQMQKNEPVDMNTLSGDCRRFQKFMKEYFKTESCFYIGSRCGIEELPGTYRRLLKLEEDNVSYDGRIFYLDFQTAPEERNLNDDKEQEIWKRLLMEQKGKELCIRLKQYLHHMEEEGIMNRQLLLLLYHDVMQVVYSVLTEHNISARDLLHDIEGEYGESLASSAAVEAYLERIIEAAVGYMQATKDKEGVVGEIKKYIDQHLGEELSRNRLAELACLNPSYLARLFRSRTGYSLVDYITKRKIEKVRDLLLTTDKTVSEIAGELGYTNMPYFSKVFKKETGCTPVEYRKAQGNVTKVTG